MMMSKIEGFTSLSYLERRSAQKYYLFLIVNVFFGSIITGAAFEQLQKFIKQSATEYVSLLFLNLLSYAISQSLISDEITCTKSNDF